MKYFLVLCSLTTIISSFFCSAALADNCSVEISIDGAIGPASLDYIERASLLADKNSCQSIFLKINTPGGNLQTTRMIVEHIMQSSRPFLCLVSPSGGHAGSAGALILQGCHVNGALEATNIGAATPIAGDGKDLQQDLRRKMIEDTKSWAEGLAQYYGRNDKVVGELVTDAKSLGARSARKENIIDYVGYTESEFLDYAEGEVVKMAKGEEGTVIVGAALPFEPDLRFQVLKFSTDPQWSYLMFMGSLGLLYFELTHPGAIAPGILGAVGLILSLISFHKLQVFWGGVALIFLGLGLVAAEFFVVSMGILSVGGAVAFVLGSILLFDFETSGVVLPISLILVTSSVILVITLGISYLAYKTLGISKKRFGTEKFIGSGGEVTELSGDSGRKGWVRVQGEVWKFKSHQSVEIGDQIWIKEVKGFHLIVTKKES